MPSIINLPKELVLEITRLSSLRDAINLLRTCKTLYDIIDIRPFWTDQLRSLYLMFQPLLPLQLNSLSVSELRKMATKPYGFERAVLKRKLRTVSPLHLKPDVFGEFEDVKIVSGGEWLVTLSIECDRNPKSDLPVQPFVRLWRISPPVRKNFNCVAAMKLPVHFAPLELYLQPGDALLDLLVFVNTFSTTDPENGSYLHVLRIRLAAEEPEISFLAELKLDRFCSGMSLQYGNVVATVYVPGAEQTKAFMWNWRNGEKLEVLSRERGGASWFIVVSEILHVVWNADSRSIGVHWSPKSDRPGEEDLHFPGLSDTLPNPPQGVQAILPVLNECRRSSGDLLQVALTHLEEETLRVDFENLGVGGVSFTRYPKDNTYMQDPRDPSDPFGNEFEAPSDFTQTVGGHLVDMSSSGRITMYFSKDTKEQTKLGESISYLAFTDFNGRTSEKHFPFMCPFSGVIGSVSQGGDFYIWRTK